MPQLTDIFTPDAFGIYELTAAIQKIPGAKLSISELGLFREIPIATTLVAVEESRGVLSLIPTTPRGGAGTPNQTGKRVLTSFAVPHIQVEDTIHADDVVNVRAFGQDGAQPVDELTTNKLITMRRSIDFTNEYLRHGALQGKVLYPDNSHTADLDLFTAFGATNQATDQTSVDFTFGTATTKIMASVIPSINDAMEAALGGTPYSGIHVLCGRTFFRNLIAHAEVKAIYSQVLAQYAIARVAMPSGSQPRMTVTLGNTTFEEYYNLAGASQGVGNNGLFQVAAEARAFPTGTDIFHTYYAPADTMDAVGTMGQSAYAYTLPSTDNKSVQIVAQSNPLNICLRPKALIRLHTSN